jgi:putative flippase GtrA
VVKKYIPLIKQIILFGIVGVTTLGIDVGVSAFCYYVLHFPAYIASGTGFLSGFFFNFPMNRKRVFHHGANDRFSFKVQVILYIALSIFNLVITSLLVDLMVNNHFLVIQYAKMVVTALIAVWNFVLFKFLIFSKKEDVQRAQTSLGGKVL